VSFRHAFLRGMCIAREFSSRNTLPLYSPDANLSSRQQVGKQPLAAGAIGGRRFRSGIGQS
jgi:hypothetical protein